MKFTLFQIHKTHQKDRTEKELQLLLQALWVTLENFTLKEIKKFKGCKHLEETKKSKIRPALMPSPIWGDERKFGPVSALCSSPASQQSPAMMQLCKTDINVISTEGKQNSVKSLVVPLFMTWFSFIQNIQYIQTILSDEQNCPFLSLPCC